MHPYSPGPTHAATSKSAVEPLKGTAKACDEMANSHGNTLGYLGYYHHGFLTEWFGIIQLRKYMNIWETHWYIDISNWRTVLVTMFHCHMLSPPIALNKFVVFRKVQGYPSCLIEEITSLQPNKVMENQQKTTKKCPSTVNASTFVCKNPTPSNGSNPQLS